MQEANSSAHGVRWGIIIGLVYCLFLFLRFRIGGDNAGIFGIITFIGLITVLILLFICGIQFRKKNGGFLEMKEAFKTMFIAVLIFELFFAFFSIIYLKYIDREFFDRFRVSTENLLNMAKQSQADNDRILQGIDDWAAQARSLNAFDILKTYLYNVAMMGLFALIFSLIIKRKQPPFQGESFHRG